MSPGFSSPSGFFSVTGRPAGTVTVCTSVGIYSVVALGLGILMGRTGLVSLGQIALLALAAWVAARLFFATGLPFPIVLLLAGLITTVLGTLVGLPALRLSGLYLALITLMLAGAITVVPIHSDCDPTSGPEMAAARIMPLVCAVSPESCPARIRRRSVAFSLTIRAWWATFAALGTRSVSSAMNDAPPTACSCPCWRSDSAKVTASTGVPRSIGWRRQRPSSKA